MAETGVAHWAARHRRSVVLLLVALVCGGVAATLTLPVGLFPQTDFPRIAVNIDAGDRPADQMLIAVTQPLEQAVRAVRGVVDVRSTTTRGSAELSINFGWDSDMAAALSMVESAVSHALPSLPVGTTFVARRMDPTVFPVAAYSLTSRVQSLVELRNLARFELMPLLSALPGVASVDVQGGQTAEYRVEVDPHRLQGYGLDLAAVQTALANANVVTAVGRLEDHYKLDLVLVDSRLRGARDIAATPIGTGSGGMVPLSAVARVYPATEPQWIRVNADGVDAVLLQIYQQPGGNTVAIVKAVDQALAEYAPRLPKGVALHNWYDQSELIVAAAASVRDAILIGVALAAVVLLVFLRNRAVMLLAAVAVPATLAITVLVMFQLHMSFNVMTLGGIAAAVGLIADDAIVMTEHILRRVGESTDAAAHSTIRNAAAEFVRPLAGSSAATVIIFVPLAFLGGVTGAFFKALSLTMAVALAVSFLIAWLIVPLLAEHLVRAADIRHDNWLTRLTGKRYRALIANFVRRPIGLAVAVAATLLLGAVGYRLVGSGFMPHMDEGGFVLDYVAPSGTSLTETDRMLRQVEAILRADPAVATYARRTGLQLGGGLTEANAGDFFVRLKPFPRAPIDAVMDRVREQIRARVPRLEIDMVLLMEDLIGDLTAVPQPIEIKLFGDDVSALLATAPRVADAIGKIDGVVDVFDGVMLAGDALTVQIDRDRAIAEGIDPQAAAQQLDAWFTGNVATAVQRPLQNVGVRVWVPLALRDNEHALDDPWLAAADGHRVPLARIADVHAVVGQPQITRDNLKTMVAVTARISGRDLGSTIADVRGVLATPGLLPRGCYFELGGLYRQQQIAFRGLTMVFAAAVLLVLVLLVYLYESFAVGVAIMVMPLLAVSAAVLGLWLTNTELNITAMMGLTMIVGIVTEVSIFYFSEYFALTGAGMPGSQALVDAGLNRMRPIVMTTLTTILALLPLALALGQGAAMQQPLAIAIISGLLVQVPLVLIVLPALFRWIDWRAATGARTSPTTMP
jgi:multidrug efflux pump subunit AcrB